MRGVLVLCRDVGDPCRDHGTVCWLNVVRLKSASGEQHVCIHDKCFTWERSLLNGQRALDMAMIEQLVVTTQQAMYCANKLDPMWRRFPGRCPETIDEISPKEGHRRRLESGGHGEDEDGSPKAQRPEACVEVLRQVDPIERLDEEWVSGWGSEKMCTGVEGRFDSEDEDDADRAELESAEHKRNGGDKCRDHVC